ncbi:MAG: uroporphyrinogen-III synthase [Methylococcales bacterium]|nr:uroporphyrinogen-III synthase [Methylococcales bacterium]
MKTDCLKGFKIVVTRPVAQAKPLTALIEQQKGEAVLFPTLAIEPLENTIEYQKLPIVEWLVFTSANAVNFFLKRNVKQKKGLPKIKIVAIGKATAKAIEKKGMKVDLLPSTGFNSEALLNLSAFQTRNIKLQHVLIVRGCGGRTLLTESLKKRGAIVDVLDVYRRVKPAFKHINSFLIPLQKKQLKVITMTSGEALHNFLSMLKDPSIILLALEIPLVVISQRLKNIAITLGFKQIFVSENPSDKAMIRTVITVCNGEKL